MTAIGLQVIHPNTTDTSIDTVVMTRETARTDITPAKVLEVKKADQDTAAKARRRTRDIHGISVVEADRVATVRGIMTTIDPIDLRITKTHLKPNHATTSCSPGTKQHSQISKSHRMNRRAKLKFRAQKVQHTKHTSQWKAVHTMHQRQCILIPTVPMQY